MQSYNFHLEKLTHLKKHQKTGYSRKKNLSDLGKRSTEITEAQWEKKKTRKNMIGTSMTCGIISSN